MLTCRPTPVWEPLRWSLSTPLKNVWIFDKSVRSFSYVQLRGVTRGSEGGRNSLDVESLWGRQITAGGAEWLQWARKSHNNVTSTFFNTVHLLPKDISFEHGGTELASCPGRHLTSLRPWFNLFRKTFAATLIFLSLALHVIKFVQITGF